MRAIFGGKEAENARGCGDIRTKVIFYATTATVNPYGDCVRGFRRPVPFLGRNGEFLAPCSYRRGGGGIVTFEREDDRDYPPPIM